ncbi:hypothetical protein STEG23_004795, partial [Scotinomys teguina]
MGISLEDEGLKEEEPFQSNQILMSKPFDSVDTVFPTPFIEGTVLFLPSGLSTLKKSGFASKLTAPTYSRWHRLRRRHLLDVLTSLVLLLAVRVARAKPEPEHFRETSYPKLSQICLPWLFLSTPLPPPLAFS